MNPKEIAVARQATAAATVEQGLVMVRAEDKREALRRILRAHNIHNAFIFCNRKKDVDILFKSLEKHGFSVVALHGDMPQSKRNDMLAKFKANEAELLVCSDVAARGLDISDVGHVINFDVPVHAEDYIHRIGRTGRAGKAGHAVTLSSPGDFKLLAAVEKMLNGPIPPLVVQDLGTLALTAETVAAEAERAPSRGRRGRSSSRRPARAEAPRQVAPSQETPRQETAAVETTAAEPVAQELVPQTEAAPAETAEAPKPVKGRSRDRNRDSRHDRNHDARGPQDRVRSTRRNPHGIAEMEIDDDVVAFGGFTPAFLLVDPYGGKGVPQGVTEIPEDTDDEDEASVDTVMTASPEPNPDSLSPDENITELAAQGR